MVIAAYFADSGVPATGLSPAINGYRVSDNNHVVNAQVMSEVGGGFYKYSFAAYDSSEDYVFVCDGGATLDDVYRYVSVGTSVDGEVSQMLTDTNELQTDLHDGGRLDLLIDAVLAAIAALNNISASDILSAVVEETLSLQAVLRICLAALAGLTDGGGTNTLHFRDAADTKNRITAIVDGARNRTTITLDGA
jgi:hypothetical protein